MKRLPQDGGEGEIVTREPEREEDDEESEANEAEGAAEGVSRERTLSRWSRPAGLPKPKQTVG